MTVPRSPVLSTGGQRPEAMHTSGGSDRWPERPLLALLTLLPTLLRLLGPPLGDPHWVTVR